jgi:GntR family transcriptional regulator, sialic acid-inducible nan operon repressor
MAPEPIQRRKLYLEVLDRLQQRIARGELAPGQHLPSERELMEQYAVGRPAVREALQALARSGIVEINHGERARVVVPTAELLIHQLAGGARHLLQSQPDMLEHLKEVRVFLEVGLARIAAQRATPVDIATLQLRLEEQRVAVHDADQFLKCDMAFHREIATISGNPIFRSMVEALFDWAGTFYRSIVRAPGAEQLTLAEHQRIIDAIAANNADAASQAMQEHLLRANALYRRGASDSA